MTVVLPRYFFPRENEQKPSVPLASCSRQDLRKQEAATAGDNRNNNSSPDNAAGDLPRAHGEQEAATATGDNAAGQASPEIRITEDLPRIAKGLPRSQAKHRATNTNGDNPAVKSGIEDVSRIADEQQKATNTVGDNPAAKDGIAEDVSRIVDERQEAMNTIGDNPTSQGTNLINMEVANENDAPAGGGTGQAALLLAAGSLPSIRSPSSTLVWLMVVQAQFLAVLSLVDSVGAESSWLSNFLEYLR